MNLTLFRHAYLPRVTLGRLYVGSLILPTLEEPWVPNPDGPGGQSEGPGRRASCIPDGTYRVVPHTRPASKGGAQVWALVNVDLGVYHHDTEKPVGQTWGRTEVLVHKGNTVNDIQGCILIGLTFGLLDGIDAVLDSGRAIERLGALIGHTEEHILIIAPTTGTTQKGIP